MQCLRVIDSEGVERRMRRRLKPATHLAILYADRGEFDRQRKSLAIFAGD